MFIEMKIRIVLLLVIFSGLIAFTGCVKEEPDEPPFTTIPFDPDKVVTIGELKNLYLDYGGAFVVTGDVSLFANVVMDESSGNIYESAFVQDHTGGIQLNFLNPGGLVLGDSIRIYLKGGVIDVYNSLYQISRLDVGDNIYKISTNNFIAPQEVTLSVLKDQISFYQSTLVKINDVQFIEENLGLTFADSVARVDRNLYIRNCLWEEIIVRTSGYANFANRVVPEKRGSIIAIASVFRQDVQLVIRDFNEINFTQPRCEPGSGGEIIYSHNFDEGWGDWTTQSDQGAQQWSIDNNLGPDGSPCAVINGFNLGYHANQDWLYSPAIDVSQYQYYILSFETAKNYDGGDIQVYISTKADFSDSELIDNSLYNLSDGSFSWTHSGYINVSDVLTIPDVDEFFIGFKYESTNNQAAEWRIDNITIKGE